MAILRRTLTVCGTLLTAFLFLGTRTAVAQRSSPALKSLYAFMGSGDGAQPDGTLVAGSGGVLYGTTYSGGTGSACSGGCGTVFSLTPPASAGAPWIEAVLYNFQGGSNDGANPFAGIAIGSGGVLYGTTSGGGSSANCGGAYGCGTIFSLTPPAAPGASWTEAALHIFTGGSDGGLPYGGLVIGKSGVLYGTAEVGGSFGSPLGFAGVVFSMTPPSTPGGSWTETVLHGFTGSDGAFPFGGVAIGHGGVLYGTTNIGGDFSCSADSQGCGTVFSLTPPVAPGGSWTETVLYSFTGSPDGAGPGAGIVIGSGGVLYGTTFGGGAGSPCSGGCGGVFSLMPPASPGGQWSEAVLHSFAGTDGANPDASVVLSSGGVIYGTTHAGGTDGGGTVYSLTPPASPGGPWTGADLYNFGLSRGYSKHGSNPYAGVVIGKAGVLYGTTTVGGERGGGGYGTVFELQP